MFTTTHPMVVTLNQTFVDQLTPSKLAYYVRALYDVCKVAPALTPHDAAAVLRDTLDRGGVVIPDSAYGRTIDLLRSTTVDILTIQTDQGRVLYQGLAAAPEGHQGARPLRRRAAHAAASPAGTSPLG